MPTQRNERLVLEISIVAKSRYATLTLPQVKRLADDRDIYICYHYNHKYDKITSDDVPEAEAKDALDRHTVILRLIAKDEEAKFEEERVNLGRGIGRQRHCWRIV